MATFLPTSTAISDDKPLHILTVYTDRSEYLPSDTVNISGNLKYLEAPVSGAEVEIQIADPSDKIIYLARVNTDSRGNFTKSFTLPLGSKSGIYRVHAVGTRGIMCAPRVTLFACQMPQAKLYPTMLKLMTDKPVYSPGELINLTFMGRNIGSTPVAVAKITAKISVTIRLWGTQLYSGQVYSESHPMSYFDPHALTTFPVDYTFLSFYSISGDYTKYAFPGEYTIAVELVDPKGSIVGQSSIIISYPLSMASPSIGVPLAVLVSLLASLGNLPSLRDKARRFLPRKLKCLAEIRTIIFSIKGHTTKVSLADINDSFTEDTMKAVRPSLLRVFSTYETQAVCVSVLVLAIAFVYSTTLLNRDVALTALVASGLIILVREAAKRAVNVLQGVYAEYRIWTLGVILLLLSAILFRVPFAFPGKTKFHPAGLTRRKKGIANMTGVATCLGLAALFFYMPNIGFRDTGGLGVAICLMSAFFTMFPISPLDGKAIYEWKKAVWLIFFLVCLALYTLNLLNVLTILPRILGILKILLSRIF